MSDCRRCGKPIDGADKYRCKACILKYRHAWLERGGRESTAKAAKKYRQKCYQFVRDYLATHPCVDCGEADPLVLEFDHVHGPRGGVENTISNLRVKGIPRLKEEIAKCEVRCANCHTRRHRLAEQSVLY